MNSVAAYTYADELATSRVGERTMAARLALPGALALVAAALGAAVAVTFTHHLVFGFDDAATHVLVPRRVFDNGGFALAQLGTDWPPLMHLVQLPVAWIDPVYRSGASGVAVSVIASLVAAYYLYRLAELLTGDRSAGVLAAVLTAACPSLLYMGVIPMTSATVVACATANVYYLTSWSYGGGGRRLLAAGLALSAATLAGYETWVLVPLELGLVGYLAHVRWGERLRTESTAILFGLAGTYGIAVFLVINVMIAGNPLAFLHFAGDGPSVGGLAAHPRAVWAAAGPALVVLGAAGLAGFWSRYRGTRVAWPALLLLYPFLFYALVAVTAGSGIEPGRALGDWENLRYATTALPALNLLVAVGLRGRVRLVAVATVAAFAVLAVRDARVATWQDAAHDVPSAAAIADAGRWLGSHAAGREVLIATHPPHLDRFEMATGLPSSALVDANDGDAWRAAQSAPHGGWLVRFGEGGGTPAADLCYRSGRDAGPILIYTLDGRCRGKAP